MPDEQSAAIEAVSSVVTYGWGAIPVKDAVRRAEQLELGDRVTIRLSLDV